jgi:hypothetical protein
MYIFLIYKNHSAYLSDLVLILSWIQNAKYTINSQLILYLLAVHLMHTYIYEQIIKLNVIHCRVFVFNATFKNISVVSWWSFLLVEETWVPEETYQPVESHWHNVVSSTHRHEWDSNSQRQRQRQRQDR